MEFTNGYALLIGVGKYQYGAYASYEETAVDAREVEAVLRDEQQCGYPEQQVTSLLNEQATRNAILAAFDTLRQQTNADSTVFIFYSGHGDVGADKSFYLTAYDTNTADGKIDPQTAVSEQELLKKMRALPAKRAFFIFNACFAGDVVPSLGGPQPEILPERTAVALLGTGEGRVIITACRDNQLSYLDASSRPLTIFGRALVDALHGEGLISRKGYIGAYDLYEAVFQQVKTAVETRWARLQEPELTINKAVGPLPMALYRGSTPTGAPEPNDKPATLSGPVRQVERPEAERVLKEVLNGNFAVVAEHIDHSNIIGGNIGGDFVAGDKVAGDKVGGDKVSGNKNVTQRNVNTAGGHYSEGDMDNRQGTFNDSSTHVTAGDITNNGGQVALGSNNTQTSSTTQPVAPFQPNSTQLSKLISGSQLDGRDSLAAAMGDYGFTGDPSDLPAEPSKQAYALIALCRTKKALTALVRGLIDLGVITADQQEAWKQWAQQQDKSP